MSTSYSLTHGVKRLFLFCALSLITLASFGQDNSVTIGSDVTSADAVLWLVPSGNGGNQGLVLPAVDRTAFTAPSQEGMVIYDTNDKKIFFWNGTTWLEVGSGSGGGGGATYTLQITGNTLELLEDGNAISPQIDLDDVTLTGDITGTIGATQIAAGSVGITSLAQMGANNGDILQWNDGLQQWEPVANSGGTSYTAGTGINITGGNVIQNTGDTDASDDITTADITDTGSGIVISNAERTNLGNQSGINTGDEVVFSNGTDGLVPDPGAPTGRVLQDDGTWVSPGAASLPTAADAQILVSNGTNNLVGVDVGGDVSIDNTGDVQIAAGVITDADINDVDYGKISNVPTFSGDGTTGLVPDPITPNGFFLADDGTWMAVPATSLPTTLDAQILVSNGNDNLVGRTINGDITIDNTGDAQIVANTITTGDLSNAGAVGGDIIKYDGTNWILDNGANKWITGSGAPSGAALSELDGTYYLNTANGDVYVKSGTYSNIANIAGADGLDGDKYSTTSSTSYDVGAGPATQAFTLDDAGLAYSIGQTVILGSSGSSATVTGTVTGYADPTLTLGSIVTSGTGSHSDWTVNLNGAPGPAGEDAYIYVGYADDLGGTNYETSASNHEFIGFLTSNTPLTPVGGDFTYTQFRDLSLADANIYVGNTGTRTEVPVTGDISLTNTGDAQIVAGSIVDADINATADIAPTKLLSGGNDKVLTTDAGGNIIWDDKSNVGGAVDEVNVVGLNAVPRFDGVELVDGTLSDDGVDVSLNSGDFIIPNSSNLQIDGVSVNAISNDPTLAGNSASSLVTEQAVKTYVDAAAGVTAIDNLTDVTITSPTNGETLQYSAGQWVNAADAVDDADNDPTNEAVDGASLAGTILSISENGSTAATVDLAALQDGVDDADNDPTNEAVDGATLVGTTLNISENGSTAASVDLAALNTDNQTAAEVVVTAQNGISSIEVQAALEELQGEIDNNTLSINDGEIVVGVGTTPTAVSMNGDAAIDNAGAVTVTGLQGVAVAATAPTSNYILRYNGSNWVPDAGGAKWYEGSTAPVMGFGNNGDFFLLDTNGDVYEKQAGNWVVVANIKGGDSYATSTADPYDLDAAPATPTFTLDDTNLAYSVGQTVIIASRSNSSNSVTGTVTAYDGTDLTLSVTGTTGSGSHTDWDVNLNGAPGPAGDAGQSAYVYIGYADDNAGAGFTTTFDPTKDYIAILSTTTEIPTPVVADFTGLWVKYNTDALGDGNILVGNGGSPQEVTMSGDVFIDNAGATTIQPDAVQLNDIVDNGGTRAILASSNASNNQWVSPSGDNQVLGSDGAGDLTFRDATLAIADGGTGIRDMATSDDAIVATEKAVREAIDAIGGGVADLQGAYDGGGVIQLDGANSLTVQDNGATNILDLDNNGTLRLGDASASLPGVNLQISVDDGSTAAKLLIENQNAAGDASLSFWQGAGPVTPYAVGIDADDGFFKIANGNEVGINPRLVIDNSGRIGIGSSAPAAQLSVGATSQFQVSSTGNLARINDVPYAWPATDGAGSLTSDGSGNLTWSAAAGVDLQGAYDGGNVIDLAAASDLTINDNATNPILSLIEATRNVGIGRAGGPLRLMLEDDANGNNPLMAVISSDAAGDASIGYSNAGGTNFVMGIDQSDGDLFKISNGTALGSNDRVIIENNGDVVIGDGTYTDAGYQLGSTIGKQLSIYNPTQASVLEIQGGGSVGDDIAVIDFTNYSSPTNSYNFARISATHEAANKTYGALRFSTRKGASMNERMIIDEDGLVGIGTSTPANLFTVGSGEEFQVDGVGNLVMVNNVPYSWPNSNGSGVLTNDGSGALSWAASAVTAANNGVTLNGSTVELGGSLTGATSIDLAANNLNFATTGGNIGINQATPTALLHIKMKNNSFSGGIRLEDDASTESSSIIQGTEGIFYYSETAGNEHRFMTSVYNTSNNPAVTIKDNGNVGIGSTTANRKLSVNSASYGISHTDGANTLSTYLGNTYAGAGGAQGASIGTETDNPFFIYVNNNGEKFYIGNSVQNYNVGIGNSTPAVKLDVTGDINASDSYYLGSYQFMSTYSTTSIHIGRNSGHGNTAGYGTFVGNNAGANTTGVSNTFVGEEAGGTNIGGAQNSFFGLRAGWDNVDGNFNTFLGRSSGESSTSGDNNVFVGYNAGDANITGSNNTTIGYNADVGSSALTNATAIGYNAQVATSNSLVLGNGANVGIGDTSPSYPLDITSTGTRAINTSTTNSGSVYSGYFQGTSTSTGSSFAIGVYGRATNTNGTGAEYGVYGFASNGTSSGSVYGVYCSGNGAYTGTWTDVSDRRFKTNIVQLPSVLDKVMLLKPSSYEYKTKEYDFMQFNEGIDYGFIAQDVEKVFPALVTQNFHPGPANENGEFTTEGLDYKGIDYNLFAPIAIKAIQEQQELIESQGEEIAELKKEIALMKQAKATSQNEGSSASELELLKAEMAEIKAMLGLEAKSTNE